MNRKSHFFFALELPESCKRELNGWAGRIKETYSFKSWVHPEDYHITLAFLGFAKEERLKKACGLIETRIEGYEPLIIQLKGLGTFGQKDSPRILWADAEETKEMHPIRKMVYEACLEAGFELDTKPFVPHITLARRSKDIIGPNSITEWGRQLPAIEPQKIDHIVLYRTDTEKLPKYEAIARFEIGK
ncbi:RNA 2',3'-cyclic phosphodiesterase [Pradoshia sp.]